GNALALDTKPACAETRDANTSARVVDALDTSPAGTLTLDTYSTRAGYAYDTGSDLGIGAGINEQPNGIGDAAANVKGQRGHISSRVALAQHEMTARGGMGRRGSGDGQGGTSGRGESGGTEPTPFEQRPATGWLGRVGSAAGGAGLRRLALRGISRGKR